MIEGLFQPTHLIIILAVVLIFFGPGKVPEVGKSIGRAFFEYRRTSNNIKTEINEALSLKPVKHKPTEESKSI